MILRPPRFTLRKTTTATEEKKRQGGQDGARAQGDRPHEHAVRDPRYCDLCHRSESPRLAYRAVRLEGHGPAARQDRGALHGGHYARSAGRHSRDRAAVFLGERGGVSLREVPRHRSQKKTKKEDDRRG